MSAEVVNDKGDHVTAVLKDNQDGTYDVNFTPSSSGTYCLKVTMDLSFYMMLFPFSCLTYPFKCFYHRYKLYTLSNHESNINNSLRMAI